MSQERVVVIGAGVGGLAAAIDLAAKGLAVTVLERANQPGGKLRRIAVGDTSIDAGPTVLTLRDVFESLFEHAGHALTDHVDLQPAQTLARHAWPDGSRLDLFADPEATADAIGALAGAAEARRFRRFSARAEATWRTLEHSFVKAQQPNPATLAKRVGLGRLGALWRINPFSTLWDALGKDLKDPRLRQLFARYATYCGSSPLQAPATLMLVAHVERAGVWLVRGGLSHLASAMAELASNLGVVFHYGTEARRIETDERGVVGVQPVGGERLTADAVVVNADANAVASGLLGPDVTRATPPVRASERSLSAMTWAIQGTPSGFPLAHHTVFFNADYPREFEDIFQRRQPPSDPTVYICAQDRPDSGTPEPSGPERLLCIVNAPPDGDTAPMTHSEIEQCEQRTLRTLARSGLSVGFSEAQRVITTPADFDRLFPGTGGALYGRASHGWTASFQRPTAATAIPGLYLAGGSTHPGPGVPMATLSGRLAAQRLLADLTSARRSRTAATSGGTSTS